MSYQNIRASLAKIKPLLYFTAITLLLLILTAIKLTNTIATSVTDTFSDFLTITTGIIVSALPFAVLGVAISVLLQRYVPVDLIHKILPHNTMLRRLSLSMFGLFMPVCECGNVPVARGMINRGISPSDSLSFLLAAPSVNIITILVTYQAFKPDSSFVIVRVIATLFIANLTAWIVSKCIAEEKILNQDFAATCHTDATKQTISDMTTSFTDELWTIIKLLAVGSMLAAIIQVLVPREAIESLAGNYLVSSLAMLLLAVVISICSSVDSFFALAYVNIFSKGSIITFLLAGPMVDVKMIALLKTTYSKKAIALISFVVLSMSYLTGVILDYAIFH